MLDRSAYVGGFDGVSGVAGAAIVGLEPTGTMPHPLILIMGDQKEAWSAFDRTMPRAVPRIALVDTVCDEKYESVMAAETLGKRLQGVRLDTPASRRGDFLEIVREVRWELDIRGHKDVKIFVSGGLDEDSVRGLSGGPIDGFGVGTSVANASTVDYSLDLVEVEGRPVSKRGKYSGRKQVFLCDGCLRWLVKPWHEKSLKCEVCGSPMRPMLKKIIDGGKVLGKARSPGEIRDYLLIQLDRYSLDG
jgi:nicotinate phosphoribosyltransferase